MQFEHSLSKLLERGTKRKLLAVGGDILAKRSRWNTRKPTHLTVVEGFLPSDRFYCIREIRKSGDDLYGLSIKNRKFIQKDRRKASSPDCYFVIESRGFSKTSTDFFSKFHSVVQVMLLAFHENDTFRAKPLAMAATDRISNRFDTIFEMTDDDFVDEYRILKSKFDCAIAAVENGLPLRLQNGQVEIVKGEALLRRLQRFVDTNISRICPTQRSLPTIRDHFATTRDFRLHFDSLYLLTNAELAALENEGEVVEQYAKSAFDLLYDVWVCCYQKHLQAYKLLHLSTRAWDDHRKGMPLILTEYSKDIRNCLEKEALSFQALRAAEHYEFLGLNFIIPESSVLYGKFIRNCIKA